MMRNQPLEQLRVIGIRYRRTSPSVADERGLDAYAASGVYGAAHVPVRIEEPRISAEERSGGNITDLGMFAGRIAKAVAQARRQGDAILMTGGDCTHATGIVGGLQDAHGPDLRLGLVWFDAHGDCNTPATSPSGMLGGMPVAVCAGLAHPAWREQSHIACPIPTNRIVLVDVRQLDEAEATLLHATDVTLAGIAPDFPGADLAHTIQRLSDTCDALYLHIDADILDAQFVPSHGSKEPHGPTLAQTAAAIDTVMASGKVVAMALVSIYNSGPEGAASVRSGIQILKGGLEAWSKHGTACLCLR